MLIQRLLAAAIVLAAGTSLAGAQDEDGSKAKKPKPAKSYVSDVCAGTDSLCGTFSQPSTNRKVLQQLDVRLGNGSAIATFTGTARCGGNPSANQLVYFLDLQIVKADVDPEPHGPGTVRVGETTVETGLINRTLDVPISLTARFSLIDSGTKTFVVVGKPSWFVGSNMFCGIHGGEMTVLYLPK